MTKREDFSDQVIRLALAAHDGSIAKAAKELSDTSSGPVSPQLLRYWVSKMDTTELPDQYDRAKELASKRNIMVENNKLRRDNRALIDALGNKEAAVDALAQVARTFKRRPPVKATSAGKGKGTPLTVELLLSDLQIGKLAPNYNTLIARKRLFEYGRAAVFQINQKIKAGYRVERIILALLGDIIESDKKHENSARATDTGTAEQMHDAMAGIFEFVLEPLARLGIGIDVVCITGNHDHDGHGLNMFQPGKQHLSYPLYKSLELVCKHAGYEHITFDIAEGSFTTAEVYGQHILYEHGVGVSVSETAMTSQKLKRSEQVQKYLTYFRMGDKHTVVSFNSGQHIVNGAFFGTDKTGVEYSAISGYSSIAAQWMGFHTPRGDERFTLYDSFIVQLQHIGA